MSHDIHLIPGSPLFPVRFEARETGAEGEVPKVFLAFCAALPEATQTIDLGGVHYTVEPMIRALGVPDKPAFALMTSAAGNVLVPIISLRKVSP
jgi:hypothetical protein